MWPPEAATVTLNDTSPTVVGALLTYQVHALSVYSTRRRSRGSAMLFPRCRSTATLSPFSLTRLQKWEEPSRCSRWPCSLGSPPPPRARIAGQPCTVQDANMGNRQSAAGRKGHELESKATHRSSERLLSVGSCQVSAHFRCLLASDVVIPHIPQSSSRVLKFCSIALLKTVAYSTTSQHGCMQIEGSDYNGTID